MKSNVDGEIKIAACGEPENLATSQTSQNCRLDKMAGFWFRKGLYLKAIRQRITEEDTNPGHHVYILMYRYMCMQKI